MTRTIWHELTPDNIFNTVEAKLGAKLSNICLKRNSYINRVYELEEYDSRKRFIVKFYRPNRWTKDQILEEHSFLQELADKEIPVIPPLKLNGQTVFNQFSIFYSLFPKVGGRAVDEFDEDGWKTLGRTIGRIHLIGSQHKKSKRLTWEPKTATKHHQEIILQSDFLLPDFERSFNNACELFLKKAEPKFKGQQHFLLHGDCHLGNLLFRPGEGLFVVDFDDMVMGPPAQDLWMLLPDGCDPASKEFNWFLEGYETFRQFDWESVKLIPALRAMRIIHYAAWLAVQHQEPDFQNHFPNAGTARYWNQLIKDLQEIIY